MLGVHGAQLKERYTTMRPYGEWLAQETVSLQQLLSSVPAELRVPPPIAPEPASAAASGNGNGSHALVLPPSLCMVCQGAYVELPSRCWSVGC
jgi:hypothetical protein